MRIVLVPVKNKEGKVFQIQGSVRDITTEKNVIAQQIRQTRYRNFQRSTALKELQKTLDTERVVILQIINYNHAKVIEEAVKPEFPKMLGKIIDGDSYRQVLSYEYNDSFFYAWEDIAAVSIPKNYHQLLYPTYYLYVKILPQAVRFPFYILSHVQWNSQ